MRVSSMMTRFPFSSLMMAMVLLLGTAPRVLGQEADSGEDKPETVFTHRWEMGMTLHTRGMGAHVELGTYRGVGKVNTWSLEVASMKHPKEVRSFNPVYEQAKSYVFGKVNAAYMARLGWGKRTIATPKLRNGAVAIGWKYAFGPCMALTKPVYLEIGYPDIPYSYVIIERYDPSIHGTDDIYGRAGALNGILEMRPQPGAFARLAIDFEYGGQREFLRTASVGVNLDAFLTSVEIMAPSTGQNDRLFLTLFVHWSFGRQQFKT